MHITKLLRSSKKRDLSDQSDNGEQQKQKQKKEAQRSTLKLTAFLQVAWPHPNLLRFYLIFCGTLRKRLRKYMNAGNDSKLPN